MKKLYFIIASICMFLNANVVIAQSHISTGDYKCRLVPSSMKKGTEAALCPACAKEDADKRAKKEALVSSVASQTKTKSDAIAKARRGNTGKSTDLLINGSPQQLTSSTKKASTLNQKVSGKLGTVVDLKYKFRLTKVVKVTSGGNTYSAVLNEKGDTTFKTKNELFAIDWNDHMNWFDYKVNPDQVPANTLMIYNDARTYNIIDAKGRKLLPFDDVVYLVYAGNDYFLCFFQAVREYSDFGTHGDKMIVYDRKLNKMHIFNPLADDPNCKCNRQYFVNADKSDLAGTDYTLKFTHRICKHIQASSGQWHAEDEHIKFGLERKPEVVGRTDLMLNYAHK